QQMGESTGHWLQPLVLFQSETRFMRSAILLLGTYLMAAAALAAGPAVAVNASAIENLLSSSRPTAEPSNSRFVLSAMRTMPSSSPRWCRSSSRPMISAEETSGKGSVGPADARQVCGGVSQLPLRYAPRHLRHAAGGGTTNPDTLINRVSPTISSL